VLLNAAAVGDDPPEAAKAVWAFDDLGDGHDSLRTAPGGRMNYAGRAFWMM
jgi:hypothetical protein